MSGKQLPTQTQRLYFTGADGSMGFLHGHAYMVSVRKTTRLERLRFNNSQYVMVSPRYCPYESSHAFWQNWSYTDPANHLKPAAPGTLYQPTAEPKVKLPKFNHDLLRSLGFDDWREFTIDFGQWAHTKDFTYQGNLYDPASGGNFGVLINAYLQERLAQDV